MKHSNKVEKYHGSLEELAHDVGNMRYDALAEFMEKLAKDFKMQSVGDKERGRVKLSNEMQEAAKKLEESQKNVQNAWSISEPYMRDSK